MEAINLLENIAINNSNEYAELTNFILSITPYLLLVFSFLTCFLGYKLRRLWVGLGFAVAGFLIGYSILPQINIGISILIGFVLAVLTIVFSLQLYKLQLFLINFVSSYIFFSKTICTFLPDLACILISLVIAIFIGLFALKYMYIVTIITTSISGAFIMLKQLFDLLDFKYNIFYYILLVIFSILGMLVQFKTCNSHIKKEED